MSPRALVLRSHHDAGQPFEKKLSCFSLGAGGGGWGGFRGLGESRCKKGFRGDMSCLATAGFVEAG